MFATPMPSAVLTAFLLAASAPTVASTPAAREPSAPIRDADLQPLFARGSPASEGKAAYDAGRYADAAAKLAKVDQPEARYVRALALEELSRHADAVRALDGLEALLPDVLDRVLFLRAEALAGAGRGREALDAWAAIPDQSLLAPEARLARARLAQILGDRDRALDAIEPLVASGAPADPSRPDPAATALLIAGRLRAAAKPPDVAGARRDLLACWSEHPLAPEATECAAAARALPAPAGGTPPPDATLRRAERLLDLNRNGQALALLQPLAGPAATADAAGAFSCRVRAALGRAHRKERNYRQAIDALRPVVESCADPELRVRSLYLLASAASIAGDRDEAVSLYRRLAREFPDHAYADDALFYAADLLARSDRVPEAREALAAIARDPRGGDFRDEARFRLAWLSRKAGDPDGAVTELLAIEEEKSGRDPYEHARAAYWRARVLSAQGDAGKKAAVVIWTDLAGRYPTDYYGLLARARLGEVSAPAPAWPSPAVALDVGYDPGPLRDDPHFRAGLALLRIGLPRAAADELGAIPSVRLLAAGDSADPVLLIADLLDRAGDHRAAHQLLRSRARGALRRPPLGENARAWRIAYPPAYRDEVKRWSAPAGVPADLLQALMREESALDPRVISPAGAIGLTQLMLPTAQSVARELRIARPTRSDLMVPSTSIRIGARFLGSLIRRFDGAVPLAVAAYNAGGGAVSRWRDARQGLALDEFVEEIPIEETRGYVKRVLRSFATYRLLYGGPDDLDPGALLHGAETTAAR
jgi:soluble lytic murein transglycosylase